MKYDVVFREGSNLFRIDLEIDADAVIFSFSDRPVQEKLGLYREDRGNA